MAYEAVTSLNFAPYLPWMMMAIIAGISGLIMLIAWVSGIKGLVVRGSLFVLIGLLLTNPTLQQEKREPLKDVALVIIDETDSQKIGNRTS